MEVKEGEFCRRDGVEAEDLAVEEMAELFSVLNRKRKESQERGFFCLRPPAAWRATVQRRYEEYVSREPQVTYSVRRLERLEAGVYEYSVEGEEREVSFSAYQALLEVQEKEIRALVGELPVLSSDYFEKLCGVDVAYAGEQFVDLLEKGPGFQGLSVGNSRRNPLSGMKDVEDGGLMEGIHTAMTYLAGYPAPFPLHLEDLNLASASYQVVGESKVWLLISPAGFLRTREVVGEVLRRYYPEMRDCLNPLRRKVTLVSTDFLDERGIPCWVHCQRAGELLIVDHSIFHAGTSGGFNVNVAMNLALGNWAQHGRSAVAECSCDFCGTLPKLDVAGALDFWQKRDEKNFEGVDASGHPHDPDFVGRWRERRRQICQENLRTSHARLAEVKREGELSRAFLVSIARYILATGKGPYEKSLLPSYSKAVAPLGTRKFRALESKLERQLYRPVREGMVLAELTEEEMAQFVQKLSSKR